MRVKDLVGKKILKIEVKKTPTGVKYLSKIELEDDVWIAFLPTMSELGAVITYFEIFGRNPEPLSWGKSLLRRVILRAKKFVDRYEKKYSTADYESDRISLEGIENG